MFSIAQVLLAPLRLFILEPLKLFYFVGPIWNNIPKEDICSQCTSIDASWWTKSQENMDECIYILERNFTSFATTVFTLCYFGVSTILTIYLLCHCCFVNPIIKEIRKCRVIQKENG